MNKRIAVIGDVHGCIDEFKQLLKALEWQGLDEIWCAGDLVDRGPDSHAVVKLCRDQNIPSVLGNHDDTIIPIWERTQKGQIHGNKDKAQSASQLNELDIAYLRALPRLHVDDKIGLAIVHAGVWPYIPLYAQPLNVIRAQMIHSGKPGLCRWWGEDSVLGPGKISEATSYAEGWRRWTDVYDHEQDIIYGHSVFAQPCIEQNRGAGRTIGIDNGICFGGALTACIYAEKDDPYFLSIKAKKVYFNETRRSWWKK